MSDKPTFNTTDIRHASFLLARGFQFLGTQDGTGKLTFAFECSPHEADAYHDGDDRVSARRLFSAWTRLRDVIDYSRGGGPPRSRSRSDAYRPPR